MLCSPPCYARLQEDYRKSPHLAAKYEDAASHILNPTGEPLRLVGLNNLLLMKHLHILILLFVFV